MSDPKVDPVSAPLSGGAPEAVEDRRVFAILFDDNEVRPVIVSGEAVARGAFRRYSDNWNAHLFAKIASNTRDDARANDNATLVPFGAAPARLSGSSVPAGGSGTDEARAQFVDALGRYWGLAYAEGKEGRDHDTEDGQAQATLAELMTLYAASQGQAPQREPMELLSLCHQHKDLSYTWTATYSAEPYRLRCPICEPRGRLRYGFQG